MTVLIDAREPDSLVDVRTERSVGDELSEARLTMRDTDGNRQYSSGDDVIIPQEGTAEWRGYVTGVEVSNDQPRTMMVRALGKRLELKHGDLQQVFYNMSRSAAVKQAVRNRAEPLDRAFLHTGSNLDGWSSNAPVFQLYSGPRAGLYEWGTDLIFVGAREGHTRTLTATYGNVSSAAIEDGIYKLQTRMIGRRLSNEYWDVEVELYTPGGTRYLWEPDFYGTGTLELYAEDAEPRGTLSSTGTLQYRFIPSSALADNTGVFIDHALTLPFRFRTRQTSLSTAGVEPTNDTITRRFDQPVSKFLDQMATETDRSWWVNDQDELQFRGSGSVESSGFSIVYGETPVVAGAEEDRDYEGVVNVVTVNGKGSIQVTERDVSSIQYHGPTSRPKVVTDTTITSESEARERAQGVLDKQAWSDTTTTFPIADGSFSALGVGSEVPVDWPPRGLNGSHEVTNVRTTTEGIVHVTLSVPEGQ